MAWAFKSFSADGAGHAIEQAAAFIRSLPLHVACCIKTSQSNQHHGDARATVYYDADAPKQAPEFPAGPAWEVLEFKSDYTQNYQAIADQLNKLDANQAYYAKAAETNAQDNQETAALWWQQNQQ